MPMPMPVSTRQVKMRCQRRNHDHGHLLKLNWQIDQCPAKNAGKVPSPPDWLNGQSPTCSGVAGTCLYFGRIGRPRRSAAPQRLPYTSIRTTTCHSILIQSPHSALYRVRSGSRGDSHWILRDDYSGSIFQCLLMERATASTTRFRFRSRREPGRHAHEQRDLSPSAPFAGDRRHSQPLSIKCSLSASCATCSGISSHGSRSNG
jgi:hypothetical protein